MKQKPILGGINSRVSQENTKKCSQSCKVNQFQTVGIHRLNHKPWNILKLYLKLNYFKCTISTPPVLLDLLGQLHLQGEGLYGTHGYSLTGKPKNWGGSHPCKPAAVCRRSQIFCSALHHDESPEDFSWRRKVISPTSKNAIVWLWSNPVEISGGLKTWKQHPV